MDWIIERLGFAGSQQDCPQEPSQRHIQPEESRGAEDIDLLSHNFRGSWRTAQTETTFHTDTQPEKLTQITIKAGKQPRDPLALGLQD